VALQEIGELFLHTGFSCFYKKPSPDIRGGEAVAEGNDR